MPRHQADRLIPAIRVIPVFPEPRPALRNGVPPWQEVNP